MIEGKLVRRADRLAFMNIADKDGPANYKRLMGFTTLTENKNPIEYSRQYVDEATETTDTVGYSSEKEYEFDMYSGNACLEKIAKITDNEITGTDAHVDIVNVDVFTKDGQGRCIARKRTYAVVPDSEGDGTDALIYSGSFKAVTTVEVGYATTSDDWVTITYTPGEIPA